MSKLANPFQSGAHAKKKECPFCRAGNRVKQAFAFFADLIKNYLSAAERAFGIKDLSSAVLAVLCGIVILVIGAAMAFDRLKNRRWLGNDDSGIIDAL